MLPKACSNRKSRGQRRGGIGEEAKKELSTADEQYVKVMSFRKKQT